jgi:hypothetical protein
MKTIKKTILLTALCMAIVAAAATADPINQPVIGTWNSGTRGVIDWPRESHMTVGLELPVLRSGIIIGIFTVDYIGSINAWGRFQSHDATAQIQPGDIVVIPDADLTPQPTVAAADIQTTSVLWGSPGGYTLWCLINRGSVDGLRPLMHGAVLRGGTNAGDFTVSFVGKRRSYGMLVLAPDLMAPLPAPSELIVRFTP